MRWQVNYRFSWPMARPAWSYRLDTLNLAFAPTTVDVFTGSPTHHVDERALPRQPTSYRPGVAVPGAAGAALREKSALATQVTSPHCQ
jgi:hypothetical protein